ncbi:hypothetical protein A8924_3237 [Saccharopolyspora erythraea NRRL 2338]|uniref:Secreted protein n=1 Tax=Saccharopolyspora erythraea TaxID=1836 RepID=A0ABN1DD20_SACER|nr:hypothetical protein N599_28960 [Saccharopolyspora erythraea D]PFG95859.1 hypothetical protein A8924_3237 [Saccharopolyspora erythraea NRRL 2338]
MVGGGKVRRRWPWAVFGAVCALAVACLAVWLGGEIVAYSRRPLSDQDSLASVTSMFIGGAALVVSVASLVVAALQLRQGARRIRSRESGEPTPGSTVQIGTASDGGRLFQVAHGDVHFHDAPPESGQSGESTR